MPPATPESEERLAVGGDADPDTDTELDAATLEPAPDRPAEPLEAEEESDDLDDLDDEEPHRSTFRLFRDVIETLVLTFVIFFVVQNFVAQPFQVQQVSMERTFESGQFVLVDKLTPRFDPLKRGDVVVFNPPNDWTIERTPFIKRVIGVGGDTIEIRDGKVFVNGTALSESYTYRDDSGAPGPTEPERSETSWKIAPGELFVMGDHRQASLDSRAFGPIELGNVIGRVSVRYWPLMSAGIVATPTY